MPTWLMKTADDTYREWSTVVDEWVSEPLTRDEALQEHPADRVEWVDKHLCSCRARMGEHIEIRDGRPIATGGGRLVYHFDSYAEVAQYCRTQDERWADLEEPAGACKTHGFFPSDDVCPHCKRENGQQQPGSDGESS